MELSKLHDSKEGPHLLMPSCLIDALQQNPLAEGDVRTTLAEDNQHDLLHALAAVPDPRSPRGMRCPLSSLLAVAVCAVLAGATTFAAIADWAADLDPPARHRLGFNGPIPVGTTVWRLLVRLDAQVLQAVLTGWLRSRVTPAPPAAPARVARMVIAIDGKLLRGAHLPDGRQVHLLSAYDTGTGLVLAQVQIDAKSNEIPAFTPLLDRVQALLGSLAEVVIVADALHTQTSHARAVAARGAHLMVTVKANQPTLLRRLRTLPWAQVSVGARTRERGHGRRETRTRKSRLRRRPRLAGLPPRRPSYTDHPHPHHRGQDHPRNRLPDRLHTRRARPARRPTRLGKAGMAHREQAALDP